MMDNSTKENILLTFGALVGATFLFLYVDKLSYWNLIKIGGGIGIANIICLVGIRKIWIK